VILLAAVCGCASSSPPSPAHVEATPPAKDVEVRLDQVSQKVANLLKDLDLIAVPSPYLVMRSRPWPIAFSQVDDFGAFHMITTAKVSNSGRFDAITEINNHVHLKGSCGTVTIWLLDVAGNVLIRAGGHQYCVDGKSIFVAGPSRRKVPWDFSIDPATLRRVAGISILHGEGAKNFWDVVGGHIDKARALVQKCPECLALVASGK
jgi:hypothetical protein